MLAGVLMRVLGLRKINRLYQPSADLYGVDFAEDMLRQYKITWEKSESQLDMIPKEGPFIIVSNHPFGAIEGVLLYALIGRRRPDFKIMANFILTYLKNVKEAFLSVNPFTENPQWSSSIGGLRGAIEHLQNGGCLGIFPAGEVSRYHGHKYPEDIAWARSVAKMIKNAKVPVIPMYIDGKNSCLFYLFSKINSLLATARLPHEMSNKRNREIVFRIGKPILPSEIDTYTDLKELAAYLRSRSYALQANIDTQKIEVRNHHTVPINPQGDINAMKAELEQLRNDAFLFTTNTYDCYLAEASRIPNLLCEIGRCREEAFRAIGEGSGKSIDTDKYDKYYHHLILWDHEKDALVGAYRLGFGKEIMPKHGLDGFYISSLFKINENVASHALETIELGRSFVSVSYQKDIMALFLLFKGLMYSVMQNEDIKYFIGPVSISTWFPKFYRSLMVRYISTHHNSDTLKEMFISRTPFEEDFLKADADVLLAKNSDSVDKFDRFLSTLSQGKYRMPTLLKRYLKLGSKFICFNVDPDFNDTLDGLLFLDLKNVPQDELDMLSKGDTEEQKEKFYKRFELSK